MSGKIFFPQYNSQNAPGSKKTNAFSCDHQRITQIVEESDSENNYVSLQDKYNKQMQARASTQQTSNSSGQEPNNIAQINEAKLQLIKLLKSNPELLKTAASENPSLINPNNFFSALPNALTGFHDHKKLSEKQLLLHHLQIRTTTVPLEQHNRTQHILKTFQGEKHLFDSLNYINAKESRLDPTTGKMIQHQIPMSVMNQITSDIDPIMAKLLTKTTFTNIQELLLSKIHKDAEARQLTTLSNSDIRALWHSFGLKITLNDVLQRILNLMMVHFKDDLKTDVAKVLALLRDLNKKIDHGMQKCITSNEEGKNARIDHFIRTHRIKDSIYLKDGVREISSFVGMQPKKRRKLNTGDAKPVPVPKSTAVRSVTLSQPPALTAYPTQES